RSFELQHPVALLLTQDVAEVLAPAAVELGQFRPDLLAVARRADELADRGRPAGLLVLDELLQPGHQRSDHLVDAGRARELALDPLDANLAVGAHDLYEQPLLRPEVVVQQAARDARLARDVVERRSGRAAFRDARAHRLDDALGLLAFQL